jgi:7-keto-8-aminopelargonate synthetase-like enzyme
MSKLHSKIPAGSIDKKWTDYKDHVALVNPANKRNIDIIIVGSGLAGSSAAASLAALEIIKEEPQRVERLQSISQYFLKCARDVDMNTGTAMGFAIIPAIIGDPIQAVTIARKLDSQGVHAKPIIYPAVGDQAARIRFFICSEHTPQMIDQAMEAWCVAMSEP